MKSTKLGVALLAITLMMFCASFAAVPLYTLFCKVTGFGGAIGRGGAFAINSNVGNKNITIKLDSNIASDLPWIFRPESQSIVTKAGEVALAYYYIENLSNAYVKGMAIYNVTPHSAGKYFKKIECFCFAELTLGPKQKISMPVLFAIDPKISELDEWLSDTLTLSYTFFKI